MSNTSPEIVRPRRAFSLIRGRALLMVIIPLLAIGVALWLYLASGRYIETDNAYLKADKAAVSSEVSGVVSELLVRENAPVSQGQLLFRLDQAPFLHTLERAEARLAGVKVQLRALQSSYREKQAEIDLARSDLAYWQREVSRDQQLAKTGAVSRARLDEATHNQEMARQRLLSLQQAQQRIAEQLGGSPDLPLEQHPDYRVAQAELEQARLDLEHTEIRAPFGGHISQLPKPGQYLEPGKAAAVLVGDQLWVEANFIEADLAHVAPGQAVRIHLDMFPDRQWRGRVESLSPATGAEFAVIPAQNATGNWVKIPQRVPVRIQLERLPQEPPLRSGLSAQVEVDTGAHCQLESLCA